MLISIITPVYNRAEMLLTLYESLCVQSKKIFEWIIIDDGSEDNIDSVIDRITTVANFPVRVFTQKNAGKHIALNNGFDNIKGCWVFIVDSDDILPPNAIEDISESISLNYSAAGFIFLKAKLNDGSVLGNKFNQDNDKLYAKDLASIVGDKAYVISKDSLRGRRFPSFKNETFVTEAYLWNRIFDNNYCICVNKIVYLAEYLEGGLSSNYNKLLQKNRMGTLSFIVSNLRLKNLSIGIYKQTIYHFNPIFNFSSFRFLYKRVRTDVLCIFMALFFAAKIKNYVILKK